MILSAITAGCAWHCLLPQRHWPPPTSQTGASIAFAIAQSVHEHALAAGPSIHSPCRPARRGEGNQTRKGLRWRMPLPDSSPSPREGKVFSSPSSPSYDRKAAAAAARGMLYIKRAPAAPAPAVPQDFSGSQEAGTRRGPHRCLLLPRVQSQPAEGPRPRPGSPGPQRAWQPPGVPAGLRFAPPQGHRAAGRDRDRDRDRRWPQGCGDNRRHLLGMEPCSPASAHPGLGV